MQRSSSDRPAINRNENEAARQMAAKRTGYVKLIGSTVTPETLIRSATIFLVSLSVKCDRVRLGLSVSSSSAHSRRRQRVGEPALESILRRLGTAAMKRIV